MEPIPQLYDPLRVGQIHTKDRFRLTPSISEEDYLIPSKRVAINSCSFELNFRAQSADED